MGGAEPILTRARKDFAAGEFRFIAQALSHLVFADPDNEAARALLADTFEQLGYLAESATWRNSYLLAAQELRHGTAQPPRGIGLSLETLSALGTEQVWDMLSVRVDPAKAAGRRFGINWIFIDTNRVLDGDVGAFHADLPGGRARKRRRHSRHASSGSARQGHRQTDDVPGCHRRWRGFGQR